MIGSYLVATVVLQNLLIDLGDTEVITAPNMSHEELEARYERLAVSVDEIHEGEGESKRVRNAMISYKS